MAGLAGTSGVLRPPLFNAVSTGTSDASALATPARQGTTRQDQHRYASDGNLH
ncbi:hypothetical protein [Roseateles sp.]|uniref:hypothetical protein n=1 Tax=Roseateles sp. TaxID=1971397 RepID=UPI00286A93C5|nr:hypothetical protein [Roseateles sp.]